MNCIDVNLRPRKIAAVLSLLATLSLLFVSLSVLPQIEAFGAAYGLLRSYGSLARENTVASWYSSMIFAGAAAAMLLCFHVEQKLLKESAESQAISIGRYGWLGMSLVFALLSLDEMGSLHERLSRLPLLGQLPVLGDDDYSWAQKLAIPIAMIAIAVVWFAWSYLRATPSAMIAAIIGVGVLATVPLQEHLEDTLTIDGISRSRLLLALEEGSELFGAMCFVAAPLLFVRARLLGATRASVRITISPLGVGALGLVLGVGLAGVIVFMPDLLDAADGRGIPQNWFPSLLALWCAASCLMVASARRAASSNDRVGFWLLLGLSAINLALSVDHGTNHRLLTARLFSPAEWAECIATAILAFAGLLVAGAIAAIKSLALRVSLLVWLALLWIGLPTSVPLRSILPFLAYLTLSVGLVMSLPGRRLHFNLIPQRDVTGTQPTR